MKFKAHIPLADVEEAGKGFLPLKSLLEAISDVYENRDVNLPLYS